MINQLANKEIKFEASTIEGKYVCGDYFKRPNDKGEIEYIIRQYSLDLIGYKDYIIKRETLDFYIQPI